MSQFFLTIDPAVNDGTDLANYLGSWQLALLSSHSGTARPSYALAGTLWLNTATLNQVSLYLFDGVQDVLLYTIDTTSGDIIFGGGGGGNGINFQGTINPTVPAPASDSGDIYVVDTAGTVDATFTPIGGATAAVGDLLTYNGTDWSLVPYAVDLSAYLPLSGGTMTGRVTLSGDPLNALHAATKQYVDNAVGVTSVPISGGTMTGELILYGNPTQPLGAVTKQYVDNLSTLILPLAGGTMTGQLTLNATPTNNFHAATKQYVDAHVDATKLPLAGGTMTGNLTLVGNGTSALHAVTKQQLDTAVLSATVSTGAPDAGKLVKTNVSGKIDPSFLTIGTLSFQGSVDATDPAPAAVNGYYYMVNSGGILHGSYGSPVAGVSVNTGDILIYDGTAWSIISAFAGGVYVSRDSAQTTLPDFELTCTNIAAKTIVDGADASLSSLANLTIESGTFASGNNRLGLLYSDVTDNPPSAGDLVAGGIAYNRADLQLYGKTTTDAIQPLLVCRFFSTTSSYAVSDLALHNGVFYRALVSISPGAFNPTQWTNISDDGLISNGTSSVDIPTVDGDIEFTVDGNLIATVEPNYFRITNHLVVGDPSTESTGINIGGTTYEANFKVSDIGGLAPAIAVFHRHSTAYQPVLIGARSNSDVDTHATVTANMKLFTLYGVGYTGTEYNIFGSLDFKAAATGTISDTSSPGQVTIGVTQDGATNPTVALTLNSDLSAKVEGSIATGGADISGAQLAPGGIQELVNPALYSNSFCIKVAGFDNNLTGGLNIDSDVAFNIDTYPLGSATVRGVSGADSSGLNIHAVIGDTSPTNPALEFHAWKSNGVGSTDWLADSEIAYKFFCGSGKAVCFYGNGDLDVSGDMFANGGDTVLTDVTGYTQAQVDALTWGADNIASGTFADARISESSVTQHQAALSITESQISDLGAYLTDITGQSITALSDVFTSMTPSDGDVLTYDTTNGWQAEAPSGGGGTPTLIEDGTSKVEIESTNGPIVGTVAGTEMFRYTAAGLVVEGSIATGGADGSNVAVGGLDVNIGTSTDRALSITKTDVDHGITSIAPTDVAGAIKAGSDGGLTFDGYAGSAIGILFQANGTTPNADLTYGVLSANIRKKSGTTLAPLSDTDIAFSLHSNSSTSFFRIRGGGDVETDGDLALAGDIFCSGQLALDRAGGDSPILINDSSLTAHSFTSLSDGNTFGFVDVASGSLGGVQLDGFSRSSGAGVLLRGYQQTGSSSLPVMEFSVYKSDGGTGAASLADTDLGWNFDNNGSHKVEIKGNGDIQAVGNITAYASDERLKSISHDVCNALKSINSFDVFHYSWNALGRSFGFLEGENIGFGAGSIKNTHLGDYCTTLAPFDNSGDGKSKSGENYLTVKQDAVLAVAVAAIKELSAQVDELRNRLLEIELGQSGVSK